MMKSTLPLLSLLLLPSVVLTQVPSYGYYDLVKDCGADPTGQADSTNQINQCIITAYNYNQHNYRVYPVYVPYGTFLVSNTINMIQQNPGPDDGINVVPGRYLPIVLYGSEANYPLRPTFKLMANSPGFNNSRIDQGKYVIYSNPGGVTMNDIIKGIDIDLTEPGNIGAVGIGFSGAQGAVAADITVNALDTTLACFEGCNGAGGEHVNVVCNNARYGFLISNGQLNAQPVPAIVGASLVNQSVTAIAFYSQETLSVVGVNITVSPTATGPAIYTPAGDDMSLIDVIVICPSTPNFANFAAVNATGPLYIHHLYVYGCGYAVVQTGINALPVPNTNNWYHVEEWARGVTTSNPYYNSNVIYINNVRYPNGSYIISEQETSNFQPPNDLITKHVWNEATFPYMERSGVTNAKTVCGAKGDDSTDDTNALQTCLNTYTTIFLPPGRYRISQTLQVPIGGSIVGMGNTISVICVATTGLPAANSTHPLPLVATTSIDNSTTNPTILAYIGITIFQHVANVYALDWGTLNPSSLWLVNYESRPCECLWTTAWQELSPPAIPCSLPVNITVPKTLFHGLGRIHAWVTDDTGGIISTGTSYRHMRIQNIYGIANDTSRLRFYALNLEHAQSETNAEIINASFVDIYSLKSEGNLPVLWFRPPMMNVSVYAFGGGIAPFWNNFTFPPEFTPSIPSIFRIDKNAGVKLACLIDHGYGSGPPYWPPINDCHWQFHYPYPGEAIPFYPYSTYPNVTMWNCWFGKTASTVYWSSIMFGPPGQPSLQTVSTPTDKPMLYITTPPPSE